MFKIEYNELKIKNGGNIVSFLVGLPFLLFSIIFGSLLIKQGNIKLGPISFVMIFFLIGILIMTLKTSLKINKITKKIEKISGFLFYSKRTEYNISDVKTIRIRKEKRTNKNSSYYVYILEILPMKFNIVENRDYLYIRRSSEQVSVFLGVNITDASVTPAVIREPQFLNETIVQRAIREKEEIIIPKEPEIKKTEIFYSDDGKSIKMVFPGFKNFFKFEVYLEPTHIKTLKKILFYKKEKTIPFSELEEFRYTVDSNFHRFNIIQLCSDNELLEFGYGISVEEIQWLYWNIKKYIIDSSL